MRYAHALTWRWPVSTIRCLKSLNELMIARGVPPGRGAAGLAERRWLTGSRELCDARLALWENVDQVLRFYGARAGRPTG